MYEVYLYMGATGAAIMVAVLARKWPRAAWALLLLWAVWQIRLTRRHAAATLADADERRAFVAAAKNVPDSPVYLYDQVPASMHSWGVEAAMSLQHRGDPKTHLLNNWLLPLSDPIVLINWDKHTRRLSAERFAPIPAMYLPAGGPIQPWQLVTGWKAPVDGYREIAQHAAARLFRPQEAGQFAWEACATGPVTLRTFVEGQEILPEIRFKGTECVHRQEVPRDNRRGVVSIDFLVGPENKVRIGSFGFKR